MAKKSLIAKANRKPKFSSRGYTRCKRCGRPRAYLRKFHLCRICFRELALAGQIPRVGASEVGNGSTTSSFPPREYVPPTPTRQSRGGPNKTLPRNPAGRPHRANRGGARAENFP